MRKKAGLWILLLVLFALGVDYFFQKETASVYSKSAGTASADQNQGEFVPKQNTDYISVTEYSEFAFNIRNIVIFIIVLFLISFIIRKLHSAGKQ
ncbi:hypothetical protein [Chryseobacterium sp. ON_d1]|uniref:hypothetical protein n=1 Tax=Chryseobacterium sp. ON_d1 TaxID=2583211 RepID=UPI00115B5127|nr:hypothetical protein [Chryseobacterium sp. ON_d1]GEJ43808.1 hypothetical protein CRS_04160 [Chryseobacterium sp. ON_d1]